MLAVFAQICPIIGMKHDLNDAPTGICILCWWIKISIPIRMSSACSASHWSVKRKRENRTRLEFIKQLIINCLHICLEFIARVSLREQNFNCLFSFSIIIKHLLNDYELILEIARLKKFSSPTFRRNFFTNKIFAIHSSFFYCLLNLWMECFNVD